MPERNDLLIGPAFALSCGASAGRQIALAVEVKHDRTQ
jgi:hypothetical protein